MEAMICVKGVSAAAQRHENAAESNDSSMLQLLCELCMRTVFVPIRTTLSTQRLMRLIRVPCAPYSIACHCAVLQECADGLFMRVYTDADYADESAVAMSFDEAIRLAHLQANCLGLAIVRNNETIPIHFEHADAAKYIPHWLADSIVHGN